MAQLQYGININGHPNASLGRPADLKDLQGIAWIRLVFLLHAAVESPSNPRNIFGYDLNNPTEYTASLARAFAHYDGLINGYARYGVRTLLILNQETYAGNAPWMAGSDGNWNRFAHDFSVLCGKIAAHYKDMPVDYEIWNEGDMPGAHSSVFVPAPKFALVLDAASKEIQRNDPDGTIVFGGLVSGAVPASQYVNAVRAALNGALPVDAVGIHPYAQRLANQPDIPGSWPGRLDEDTLAIYSRSIPEPLWITEIGISEPGAIKPKHYEAVAQYMRGAFSLIESKYSERVPVVIWFGWSDIMREAGITDINGLPKAHIYDTFVELVKNGTLAESPLQSKYRMTILPTIRALRVRRADGTGFDRITSVKRGDKLAVLEDPELAIAKLGKQDQWVNIRTPDNVEGWTAAWLVEPTAESEAVLDTGKVPVPFFITPTVTVLNIRSGDLTQLAILDTITSGEVVDVVEDPVIAFEKARLGANQGAQRENHWVRVRKVNGVEGWAAAWFLTAAVGSEIPDPLPDRPQEPIRVDPAGGEHGGTTTPGDPQTVAACIALIQQAYSVEVTLDSVAEFDEMQQAIANLQNHGVALRNSHEQPKAWSLGEVQRVNSVVAKTAQATAGVFKEMYGVDDGVMTFKALYAPLLIERDARHWVGPHGERWLARNSNGFEMMFGDGAFFEGSIQAKALSGTTRKFTSEQLIAHEVAHAINWRYWVREQEGIPGIKPRQYFTKHIETADGLGENDGLTFGAQSSKEDYETSTDAIANFNMDALTADNKGKIRRAQLTDLMKRVVRYRVQEFNVDLLEEQVSARGGSALLSRVSPVIGLANLTLLDNWLGTLVPVAVPADGGETGEDGDGGPEPPAGKRSRFHTNTVFVNVRSGPGTEFEPSVGKLDNDSIAIWYPDSKTRDRANRFDWVKVETGTVEGWIAWRPPLVDFEDLEPEPQEAGEQTNAIIDVSHWQIINDWQAIADDGIRAIIHKVTQGTSHVDTQYAARQPEATSRGFLWGAYHFGTGHDGVKQAEHFLNHANADENTLLVLDFETNATDPTNSMDLAAAEAFVQHVHDKTGKWPVIYTGNWYLKKFLSPGTETILSECPLWLAAYTQEPPTVLSQWTGLSIWQYTNGVQGLEPRDVKGITRVDRDIFNGSMDELEAFWVS